jgi:DNA-binding GntR family transcriptional regulator
VAHAADEHRQIYRAIRDRDPDRAARAARDHVRQAQARYQAACRQAGQGGDGGVQLAGTG